MKKREKEQKQDSEFKITVVSSRGQVTIPQEIRDYLHIGKGSVVAFETSGKGVMMVPMRVEPKDPYTDEEWGKIEKLSKSKGEVFDNPDDAKEFLSKI